jgi:hypothetical protein
VALKPTRPKRPKCLADIAVEDVLIAGGACTILLQIANPAKSAPIESAAKIISPTLKRCATNFRIRPAFAEILSTYIRIRLKITSSEDDGFGRQVEEISIRIEDYNPRNCATVNNEPDPSVPVPHFYPPRCVAAVWSSISLWPLPTLPIWSPPQKWYLPSSHR